MFKNNSSLKSEEESESGKVLPFDPKRKPSKKGDVAGASAGKPRSTLSNGALPKTTPWELPGLRKEKGARKAPSLKFKIAYVFQIVVAIGVLFYILRSCL
jgi:hypothetical protein